MTVPPVVSKHIGTISVFAGMSVILGLVAFLLVKQNTNSNEEHAKAEAAVIAGEIAAEKIVVVSERKGCTNGALITVNFLNSEAYIVEGDEGIANDPFQSGKTRAIRRNEARGINREDSSLSRFVDYHFVGQIHRAYWRNTAMKAHFDCKEAYPFPSDLLDKKGNKSFHKTIETTITAAKKSVQSYINTNTKKK